MWEEKLSCYHWFLSKHVSRFKTPHVAVLRSCIISFTHRAEAGESSKTRHRTLSSQNRRLLTCSCTATQSHALLQS